MRRLTTFLRERRGAAAIEFAFILPLVLLVYVASQDVALAFSFQRKLDNCAANLADLTAQLTSLSRSEVAKVLDVRYPILAPFDDKRLGARLSVVTLDAAGKSSIAWSIAPAGSILAARTKGSAMDLPKEMVESGETSFIFAETSYRYDYVLGGFGLTGSLDLAATSYARSRGRALPSCTDC
ncbi:pilus assembly protein [Aureimonas endophytica]|uniref:Pilus assembly protein n=1 Tax=Aureimonas endophytica TaxID=2027858 RepID=A0A917A2K6_9HYPH|nr:TadE/TadG family type IV pilus assembly protein [Aureimonas endophytica]GGE22863.1 pilus assembly protein [Aureimonas endophytica]